MRKMSVYLKEAENSFKTLILIVKMNKKLDLNC